MSALKSMVSKLVDYFDKRPESNISKVLAIFSKPYDEFKRTLEEIDNLRDIDYATGWHLDKIGTEFVQEYRDGDEDDIYRLRIKTKIMANLSRGDIDTMNTIFDIYLGGDFLGMEEGWDMHGEPASLYINIRPANVKFPMKLAKKIKAAGIRIQPVREIEAGTLVIYDDSYNYPVYYKACGEFSGEKDFSQINLGAIEAANGSYDYTVEYPVSEKGFTQSDIQPVETADDSYSYQKHFLVTGEMELLHKSVTTGGGAADVSGSGYEYAVTHQVCGEFYAEGE